MKTFSKKGHFENLVREIYICPSPKHGTKSPPMFSPYRHGERLHCSWR